MEELDIRQSALLTDVGTCINHYRLFTPGIFVCINATVQIDETTRVTPGLIAMVNNGKFKQCTPHYEDKAFHGPPNLIIDIASENNKAVYQKRRDCFEKNKVQEYILLRETDSIKIEWNRLVNGKYELVKADDDGLIKSKALPGLWIPVNALQIRDLWVVMATIERGITRKEHHDFMGTIWNHNK